MPNEPCKSHVWKRTQHPLLRGSALMEVVSGDNVTMCRFSITECLTLPAHAHLHEQLAYVILGRMRLRVGDSVHELGPGDVMVIPGNVEHSAEILEVPFQELDVFAPVREDFLALATHMDG